MAEETQAAAETEFPFTNDEIKEITETFLTKGGTFKDIRGLTDKDMEVIYSLGYNAYNNGRYEDADKIFRFLSFYDHLNKKYFMGLGAARQMLKNYEGAVQAYSYVVILDVEDPRPHLHAADCFMAMQRYKEAESALLAAIHWSGDKAEYEAVKDRADAVLKVLESKD